MPGAFKVLIVEDEPSVAHALGLLLDLHGIPTLSAGTPAEALRLLAGTDVGLVIQDMNFDGTDTSGQEGIRLFRRIRQADPDLPILLMTAWASLETAVRLVKEGADDYFAKPWDDEKLVIAVQNLLRMRRLQIENAALLGERSRARRELAEKAHLCGMVYESDEMHRLVSLAVNVAGSDASVLLTGPSGSGKETLAEIIHANSRRRDKTFLRLNVGALPQELMEGELFGAEPGAYTGAKALRLGHFEAADGGTVFLDEIDALPLAGQVKLLRVVQSGEFQRLGSSRPRRVDVRILSATNADLRAAIAAGRFREDLYYRLAVVELGLPALVRRREDILPLAHHFLGRTEPGREGPPPQLTAAAEEALLRHSWEGNVRELQNRVRRAVLTSGGMPIGPADLDLGASPVPTAAGAAREAPDAETEERLSLEAALLRSSGIVSRAAEQLGLSRQALYRRMEKLGIVLERRPRS